MKTTFITFVLTFLIISGSKCMGINGYEIVNVSKTSIENFKEEAIKRRTDKGFNYHKEALEKVESIHDEQSFKAVVNLFNKAVENNYYPASTALGILYKSKHLHGSVYFGVNGNPNDLLYAIECLKMAAKHGSNEAQNILAETYLNEANITDETLRIQLKDVNDEENAIKLPDLTQAIYWFELAAKNGNPAAQGTLADLYEQGIGVPQDYVMSYVWQNISIASQFQYNEMMQTSNGRRLMKVNIKGRDKTYTKLTSKQKDYAQKLVNEYKAKYIIKPSEYDLACKFAKQIIIAKTLDELMKLTDSLLNDKK